jgi:hypothetical protein
MLSIQTSLRKVAKTFGISVCKVQICRPSEGLFGIAGPLRHGRMFSILGWGFMLARRPLDFTTKTSVEPPGSLVNSRVEWVPETDYSEEPSLISEAPLDVRFLRGWWQD